MTSRTQTPQFGEVWVSHAGVLPGATYLIVSSDDYNEGYHLRIVVEVIGDRLAAGHGGLLVDLGPIGSAVAHAPITVSLAWFKGSDEPVHMLTSDQAQAVAGALRRLLG